jgi:hypothetical protein
MDDRKEEATLLVHALSLSGSVASVPLVSSVVDLLANSDGQKFLISMNGAHAAGALW